MAIKSIFKPNDANFFELIALIFVYKNRKRQMLAYWGPKKKNVQPIWMKLFHARHFIAANCALTFIVQNKLISLGPRYW